MRKMYVIFDPITRRYYTGYFWKCDDEMWSLNVNDADVYASEGVIEGMVNEHEEDDCSTHASALSGFKTLEIKTILTSK